jgi:hypothetical protein
MDARKIICRTLIMGIGFLVGGPASAFPWSQVEKGYETGAPAESARERFLVGRYESGAKKPKFPPPDERKKIKGFRRVLDSYPRISISGGYLFRFQDDSELNCSFRRFEAAYGFEGSQEYSGSRESCSIGLRLYVAQRWSLWCEYAPGGEATLSSISLSGLYSVIQTRDVSVSIGVGGVSQRLKAAREYNYSLVPPPGYISSTLQKISIETGNQTGWLFSTVLDFWGQASGHTTGFFLALQYISAPTVSKSLRLPHTLTEDATEMRISMTNLLFTGGLTFTFQI